MPLNTILVLLDGLIALAVNQFVSKLFPAPRSCFEGAQRYTQPLDKTWALSQVIKKV